MSKYISLSGHLVHTCGQDVVKDCIHAFSEKAHAFNIDSELALFYEKCWNFPDCNNGSLNYVFFGWDVLGYAETYMIYQILAIIEKVHSSISSDKTIEGRFYYEKEEGEKGLWLVDNSGIRCYVIDNIDENGRISSDDVIDMKLSKKYTVSIKLQ